MNSRERIKATIDFQQPDRIGIHDTFWDETLEAWQKQGFPKNSNFEEYFDFDIRLFSFDQEFMTEEEIYVKSQTDWEAAKGYLKPGIERLDDLDELKKGYEKAKNEEKFLVISFSEPFENISQLLGREETLIAMAHQPKWTQSMFQTSMQLSMKMFELLKKEGFNFDAAWLWGDLAYARGLFFSPDTYKHSIMPFHKELHNFFKNLNLPVIYHSDGDLSEIIPLFLKIGIKVLHPLESDCGFDLVKLRREFGRDLVIFGNFDTRIFQEKSTDLMEEKISEKINLAKELGGYIYNADKPVSPQVSLANYKLGLELIKKYGQY